ncbi:sigma-70 family RNA polymerase sigma factor [Saccharomonospora xinjiangensis]|uniref:sigma-70 family RNA polymerase sigma factor n=1 Tax=Saccharomonospora xinjiangensis TaxID=75294 RepID=UPI00106FB5BF|nr:sigma-70 family RNA polymerase sigma factor [Saccharomonospora xinjiangensis]QBQ60998.1 putative ECF RNA polymerase sigma factor SigI [Saccharomonospora xinjiangensis]
MTTQKALAEEFEGNRQRLLAMATRVLGSSSDAQDVVQEAWLRLVRQEPGSIENLAGWLTTTVGRLCIDVLRSRTAKGEVSYEEQFQAPVVLLDDDPEDLAVQADRVGLALLVVLRSLRPDERLAFVLHDMFAVPFTEIAAVIEKSPDAAKMMASRARRKVQGAASPAHTHREKGRVVDAFLAAARHGDFDALLEILDPDLTWELHGQNRTVSRGRTDLLRALKHGTNSDVIARRVVVNGQPGILAWSPEGTPVALMACTVHDGRMTRIASLTDRSRLDRIDLPAPVASEGIVEPDA